MNIDACLADLVQARLVPSFRTPAVAPKPVGDANEPTRNLVAHLGASYHQHVPAWTLPGTGRAADAPPVHRVQSLGWTRDSQWLTGLGTDSPAEMEWQKSPGFTAVGTCEVDCPLGMGKGQYCLRGQREGGNVATDGASKLWRW